MGLLDNPVFGFPAWTILAAMMGILLPIVIIMILVLARGKNTGPVEENMALIIPEDEQGIIQVGQLVGNVERTEDKLIVTNPDWKDDDGNEYTAELDIASGGGTKICLPFMDVSKALKKLWFILDKGDLNVVSISTLLHGLPKRWDPPLADRRKTIRFLVTSHPGQTITNALASRAGVLVISGLILGGMLGGFFLVVVSGHFH